MNNNSKPHPFLPSWLTGKHRRIQTKPADDSFSVDLSSSAHSYQQASNTGLRVFELIRPILESERCLVVTGYQDFLSALSIISQFRPEIASAKPDTLRIIFGTNTDNSLAMRSSSRTLPDEVKHYFLGRRGLSVDNDGDILAILGRDAIKNGAINFRIFDTDIASKKYGKSFRMLHAKAFIGETAAIMGSANFSRAGLMFNVELADKFPADSDAYAERKKDADGFWECGRDWNQEALEVLDRLLRLVTPEEAAARTAVELRSFGPWDVSKNTQTAGRIPAPYQSELIYEASGTVYEHGFAFIEAPTGAGKTDIGKHLGAILPEMYDKTVLEADADGSRSRRKGSFGIVPPRVVSNWDTSTGPGFRTIPSSMLSKDENKNPAKMHEVRRAFLSSAACIIDESHTLNSRWLSPSSRSRALDESPSIWTACLSATLLGNQGLDGLLAFHEKRASIYMSPEFSQGVGRIIEGERSKIEEEGEGEGDVDLFGEVRQNAKNSSLKYKPQISTYHAQVELSESLAPFVCRRERSCIGESSVRRDEDFTFPEIHSVRKDDELTERQKEIIDEISDLATRISEGRTITTPEHSRVFATEVNIHDKARLSVRNFLASLRTSVLYTRHGWKHEALGRSLREAESRKSFRKSKKSIHDLQSAFFLDEHDENPWKDTPLCKRIDELIFNPELDDIDHKRADEMVKIIVKHGQAIFLAERTGPLQVFAQLVGERGRKKIEVMTAFNKTSSDPHKALFGRKRPKYTSLLSGTKAQDYFGRGYPKENPDAYRVVFMTYQMAEGVNLQSASALGLISVTSDTKNMVQGMGRIDRIDSRHACVTYYTFDLPGLVLASDAKAKERTLNTMIFSGKSIETNETNVEVLRAGELTDRIIKLKRSPRKLRRQNFYDTEMLLEKEIDNDVFSTVKSSKPVGVWGADLCILQGNEEFTLFTLRGMTSKLGAREGFFPPRLIAVNDGQVLRGQVECINLLLDGFIDAKSEGKHKIPGTKGAVADVLEKAMSNLMALKQWDLRPERTVSLLASLAAFLDSNDQSNELPDDLGESMFGELTLPAIEYLANEWSVYLDPSWIEVKKRIQAQSEAGGGAADYIDITDVVSVLHTGEPDKIDRIRDKMFEALNVAKSASSGSSIGVEDRIAVIFQSTGV